MNRHLLLNPLRADAVVLNLGLRLHFSGGSVFLCPKVLLDVYFELKSVLDQRQHNVSGTIVTTSDSCLMDCFTNHLLRMPKVLYKRINFIRLGQTGIRIRCTGSSQSSRKSLLLLGRNGRKHREEHRSHLCVISSKTKAAF
uniref:(northern house mosquito) hypothetical protein n=1 Tax=Culex pipiens TaxID=7175 RepID=A0A8D8JTT2_CULPI